MSTYSYETDLDIRFNDIDALGHVNNAVYASYCEHARLRFLEDELDLSLSELHFVVANLEIDFHRPIEDAGVVTVGIGVTDVGTSSFTMGYAIRFEGEVAATAETVQVAIDPETKQPTDVPDAWRAVFEQA